MPSSAPVSLLLTLLLAVLCCCTPAACSPAFSFVRSVQYSVGAEPWQTYNQTEFVFHQQRVDHFSLTNRSTYAQRFFVIDQFVQSPTTAPVLYNLCGEYTCPGIRSTRLYPLQLAYELHALVVIVEHRYYGASYPTPPTTANYVLLNSRQALEDFAFFQQWYQLERIDRPHGGQGANRWLVIGGSYPGALSAWYRAKYPHLVVGSLASSAVVEAILDFPQFDAQVERSAGPICAAALRNATALVEAALPGVMSRFGCPAGMNEGDFLFMLADSGAEGVQYGLRETLCNALVPAYLASLQPSSTPSTPHTHSRQLSSLLPPSPAFDLLSAFVNYTTSIFFGVQGNSCEAYSREHWKDLSLGNADRSWGWQTCTEVGYFQVARAKGESIRSQRINRTYYQDLCRDVFGVLPLPAVAETNLYYGGWNITSSNIFFVNGVEDPWQWASVRQSLGDSVPAVVVNCTQCAHCVDLVTPTADDAPALKETRERITTFVHRLLA